jgi:hypothetical protein
MIKKNDVDTSEMRIIEIFCEKLEFFLVVILLTKAEI